MRIPERPHAPLDPFEAFAQAQPDVTSRDVLWDGRTPDYDACVGALM